MKLYSINTGYFRLDGGAMFGVVPKLIWNKLNPADDKNLCNWAMRSLLIEDGSRLILIDNGMGDKQDAKFFSYYYLNGEDSLEKSLAKHGFSTGDITDVFLTHLHFDHCGGSIKNEGNHLVPAFKNAQYWSNARHWKWATHPNDREKASFLKENILPIQESGQLQFITDPVEVNSDNSHASDEPGKIYSVPFTDHVSVYFVSGHTEMMMIPKIRYNGKTIFFVTDLIPSVSHLPIPYVMSYDMFPLTTLREKKLLLTEAYKEEAILFFQHDPTVECCTLELTARGIRQKETSTLQEMI